MFTPTEVVLAILLIIAVALLFFLFRTLKKEKEKLPFIFSIFKNC